MMDNEQISQHISQQFNEDLENVRQQVLEMGGLVERQLSDALDAFEKNDEQLADKVVQGDKTVNRMELTIDDECTKILAKRQPAAGDLRLVIAITKTINDLERVGDEAQKVARMARDIAQQIETPKAGKLQQAAILHMGKLVKTMLRDSLDAFARMDVETAMATLHKETTADEEYNSIIRQQITYMMEDPRTISAAMDLLWSARALERIGDHASNICEHLVYLVQGQDVRHMSLDEIRRVADQ